MEAGVVIETCVSSLYYNVSTGTRLYQQTMEYCQLHDQIACTIHRAAENRDVAWLIQWLDLPNNDFKTFREEVPNLLFPSR